MELTRDLYLRGLKDGFLLFTSKAGQKRACPWISNRKKELSMQFSWIAFYEQIADKLAAYALTKRKGDLFAKVRGSRARSAPHALSAF